MKSKLLTLILCLISFTVFSQVIWTGGGGTADWNTSGNWSTNTVPTLMDDVEIPSGFTVTISGGAPCKSLELKGNAILNIDTVGGFSSSQPSFFEAGTTVNWAKGTIDCSLLVNEGTMNLTSSEDKLFEQSTLVNNNGTINIIGSGDLFLRNGTVLNNEINGTIDMRADDGDIDDLGGIPIVNNAGLIKRTTSSGVAQIKSVELNNNGGIIQVDSGTLRIGGFPDDNFMGGTYVVSSGALLDWDGTTIISGVLMGTIEGELNWNNEVTVSTSATVNFTGSGNFNWTGGILNGGGILTNESNINLSSTLGKSIQEGTTLNNSGTISIIDTGDLFIQNGSIVNNLAAGVIDLQANSGNVVGSGGGLNILNNTGLITRTTTTGEAKIDVELNNNNGIIQVENGTLSFDTLGKNLTDGIYNVFSGAVLDWDSSMALSGDITGVVDGSLNWNNILSVSGTAVLSLTGSGNINWTNQALNGGGTLTNQSALNLTTNGNKFILEDTTLNNLGIINIAGGGDLFITQGILNNQTSGIIDMQSDEGNITRSGGTSNILNNIGLLKRTTTSGTARIFVELNNSGTIEVETGELEIANSLPFTNEINGIVKGVGIFDLPSLANYTNDGVFAPGLSPGNLSVEGDYKSSTNSVLDLELNGLTQESEYDLLAITGNADFNGDVQVTLNFDADVNDEFIVATTSGAINTCNLPTSVNSAFGGFTYEFDVVCRNNNELVLTVISALSLTEEGLLNVNVFPNPVKDYITIENVAIERVFILDINGRKILESTQNKISLQHLVNGVYFLRIEDENQQSFTRKIIKH